MIFGIYWELWVLAGLMLWCYPKTTMVIAFFLIVLAMIARFIIFIAPAFSFIM